MSQTMNRPVNPANDPARVRLDNVVVAYADGLTKARAFEGGVPKFGASFIAWGKGAADMDARVTAAMEAAATSRWGDRKMWPPRLRGLVKEPVLKPCRDFPKMLPEGAPGDAMFIRANSLDMPGFVDAQGQPLTAAEVSGMLYSGWFVNVTIRAYAFEHASGDGVSIGLQNIQLVRPGKRLGGRAAATSEFGPVTDEQLQADNDNPFAA